MSHQQNTRYFEDILERFNSSTSGSERADIIKELQSTGLSTKAEILVGMWYAERQKYLDDHNLQESDVYLAEDSYGVEYWVKEEQSVHDGEPVIGENKVMFPLHLNVDYWLRITIKN